MQAIEFDTTVTEADKRTIMGGFMPMDNAEFVNALSILEAHLRSTPELSDAEKATATAALDKFNRAVRSGQSFTELESRASMLCWFGLTHGEVWMGQRLMKTLGEFNDLIA